MLFICSSSYSYLLEDTIYLEIKSNTLSAKEINNIYKTLILRFEKLELGIDKNKKRATYKYSINLDKNNINIINLKTNRKNIESIKNNDKTICYVFDYVLKDSKIKYDKEDYVKAIKIKYKDFTPKRKQIHTTKRNKPKQINPYSYFICAFLPGANNLYLPYILNPVDNESYVDLVGDYGQVLGGITGGLGGILTGLTIGNSHNGTNDYPNLSGMAIAGILLGSGAGFIGGYYGDGGSSYGAFTGIRLAYHFNHFNAVFLDNKAKYLGTLMGLTTGATVGYFMGNIFTSYGYETRATGAIFGGIIGMFGGIITIFKDKKYGEYEQNTFYDYVLVTEGVIYLGNLASYLITYFYFEPNKNDNSKSISLNNISFEPIFYENKNAIMMDTGAKVNFSASF